MACAAALPALLIENHGIHYPLVSKSTLTHSDQIIDHGSTIVDHGTTFIHEPIFPLFHEISSKKSTLTKSSQVVNHGGTAVVHAPVYHSYHPVTYGEAVPSKTTVTKSNQIVNHGSTTVVHAPVLPVLHTPVVHTPIVHTSEIHTPIYSYYSSPLSIKTGDSAISHHSSTVRETEPLVNHLPLYALHH